MELISEKIAREIGAIIYFNAGKEISLVDNHTTILKRYMYLPVNIRGVRAYIKCYIIGANTYNLLLSVR